MHKEFLELDHRPYPLPASPWIMTQTWENVLFMHYPIQYDCLRPHIPEGLEIDTFNGQAWITVLPFKITNMRVRYMPAIPLVSSFLELNVRTYVKKDGIPGIYFFSLDASELLAVVGAQASTGLPYRYARMSMRHDDNAYHFNSTRRFDQRSHMLDVSYTEGPVLIENLPDTLDHWLLERYCLYTFRLGMLLRGDIHHDKWKVTQTKVELRANSMLSFLLKKEPELCHFSKERHVYFYPFKQI
ncbi:YqjF family protein [Bacillus testis]|uniref:YqjF family protein n=1 Tax=Bacillus testis TaxID=1622072 RepID=UPI00067EA9E5|nr:DUF2071 domain-containing protein [Bacillus testis]